MAGGAPSVLPLSLLLLVVCSAVVTNAKPYWRSGHYSGGHYSPAGAWAGALPSPRLGAEWNPLLHTSHHRYGHGHAHSGHHGGGRASAMAGAGGPWALTGGRGAWAVSGGGSGGPWAVTSGGRAGPWAVTGDGRRHSLYAMNGVAWPGLRQPQPVADNRWGHHFGHHWQVVRTPSLGHHGWGIYWAHNGRRDCDHQGRHRPEHQPDEEEQPEEREEEREEDEDIPDDFDGSGFFPEVRFDFPRLPEITPSWPDFIPEEPEDTTPEAPEETPEPPVPTTPPQPTQPTPPPVPTQPEKTDCPESAVFLDGECVCPDSKPFLDTILSRCVDIKPVIH